MGGSGVDSLPGRQGHTLSRAAWGHAVLFGIAALVILGIRIVQMPSYAGPSNHDAGASASGGFITFAPAFRPPQDRLEVLYNTHDGQAFASLAMDPTLSRPQAWSGGRGHLAYRAARPLFGWLIWAGSFGQPGLVEWSLAILSVASAMALGAAATHLAFRSRRRLGGVPLVLVVPGMLVALLYPGVSDPLATALVLFGLCMWMDGRLAAAVVLCSLAILTRETTVVVPLAIAMRDLHRVRRFRPVLVWLIPPMLYVGWVAVVRARVGALPTDFQGNIGLPLKGLVKAITHGWTLSGFLAAVLITGLFLAAVTIGQRRGFTPAPFLMIIALSVLLGLSSGWLVWWKWDGLSRSLLPAQVLALVLLLPRLPELPQGDAWSTGVEDGRGGLDSIAVSTG